MDNFKNLETDTNNSSGISPTSVPEMSDTKVADVPDDLSMRNDDDLFGEPVEDPNQKGELPQSLEENPNPQAEQEQEVEPEQKLEQQPNQQLSEIGQQQQNQESLSQNEDTRNTELPSTENSPQGGERIDDNSDHAEEGKFFEATSNLENEPNMKVKNEEGGGDSSNEEKEEKEEKINVNQRENEGKNENENIRNDDNTENNNNNDMSNSDITTTGRNDNNNEVNKSRDKDDEKPFLGIEHEGEKAKAREAQNSLEYPSPQTASTMTVPTPITTTTTNISAPDNKDLAIPQSHEIVIPSYAKWFNLTKIHPIERQSLPEFFTNRIPSKTPQVYVKCRNFMVNSYRLNPNEYFSVTAARRNVSGDAAAVFRIHKFLMKWGLINYQVDAQLMPKSIEPPFTGEYSTRHDAPRGLFPFESYKPSVQLPDMAKLKKMMDTDDSNSALHKYLKEEERKSQPAVTNNFEIKTEDKEKNHASEDSEKEDPKEEPVENPHGAKRPRVVKSSTTIGDDWQENEVEKLLKAIQTYGSEWYKIAKEVGNKTPEQCILKFIQMPIEDKFLHQSSEDGSDLGSLKYAPHLPFSKSENPVMSTLAFLVGLVDPKVVQNMTERALRGLEPKKEDNNASSSTSQSPPPPTIKEASQLAIASLGVRSHVFANNEERQMTSIAHQMAQIQLQKVEVKLKFLDQIEKSLELEKKTLQRQQEDVLIQRISLTKHTKDISQKLEDSLHCFDDKEKLTKYVEEIKSLVSHPPKLSVGSAFTSAGSTTESGISADNSEKDVQPVSVEAPQSYRYWSA